MVNGSEINTGATSLVKLLEDLGIRPDTVAIELNGQIAKRDTWKDVLLKEADKIEIIKFVGGG
ncbi:MAG TPA: sulfur carrier protein ThiS [Leptospiraceae bacterium]|nr:sulfur carrier protein ThiS [Leptospiraceae bacterium]